jgi:hypothetical protein
LCAFDPFESQAGHLFTLLDALSCAIFSFFYLGICISCGVLRHDSQSEKRFWLIWLWLFFSGREEAKVHRPVD